MKEDPRLEAADEDPIEEVNTNVEGPMAEFLVEFHDVFPADLTPGLPAIHGIEHQIDLVLGASLPKKAAYRCNTEETKELQKQVDENRICF